MSFQKNFVIKNGLEVNNNLIYADRDLNKVGIGTTIISNKFQVVGGAGIDELVVSGVGTVSNLLELGGYLKAGNTTGNTGDYLISTGAGVTWGNYTFTAFRNKLSVTATPGQTGFTTAYAIGLVDVFVNGVRLTDSEFTANNGSTIVLSNPCFGGESVDIFSYTTVSTGISSVGTIWVNGPPQWVTVSSGIYTGVNVGVGTTNPLYKLHIVGLGSTALFVSGGARVSGIITAQGFSGDGSLLTNISASYASTAGFSTYTTTAGLSTYAVRSGISTYTPTAGFSTYSSTAGLSTYAVTAGFSTNAGVSTSVISGFGSISQLQVSGISTFLNGPIFVGSASSTGTPNQRLQIAGNAYFSGNIGVGTTNPTRLVHLFGDGSTNQLNVGLSVNTLSSTGYGVYLAANSSTIPSGRDFRIISTGSSDASGVGKLVFYDMTSSVDRLVIDSGGNIGVGSTTPISKFTVVGNASITGIITASNFVGNLTGYANTAGVSTSVISGFGSISQLQVSGISTFLNGPIFVGSASSTGFANQRMQITGNAYVSGNVGLSVTNPSAILNIGAATTSAASNAPLKINSGGTANLLLTPEVGAIEYDGSFLYHTPNNISGRSYIPPLYSYRLTASASPLGTGIVDFFATPSSLNLEASSVYKIECFTYFTKTTAGITTWTQAFSSAPTISEGYQYTTPTSGMTAATSGSYTQLENYFYNQGATTYAWNPSITNLTTAVNHLYRLDMTVYTASATNWRLRLTQNAGTATPLAGSYYKIEKIGSSTGIFTG